MEKERKEYNFKFMDLGKAEFIPKPLPTALLALPCILTFRLMFLILLKTILLQSVLSFSYLRLMLQIK